MSTDASGEFFLEPPTSLTPDRLLAALSLTQNRQLRRKLDEALHKLSDNSWRAGSHDDAGWSLDRHQHGRQRGLA